MSMYSGWNEVTRKKRQQKRKKGKISKHEIKEWQKYWRKAGPVRFAEELLTCPLDVPQHPDYDTKSNPIIKCNKYCPLTKEGVHPKFRDNGTPFHIILSEDQKQFLNDLWNGETMALVSAARSAGKTFCLAIWNCWQIVTQDHYSITCMGGSSEQSELIQDYIDNWRIDIPFIKKIIYKMRRGIKKDCSTIGRSKCKFPACSVLAARGPHVNEVDIDEACAAEDKSKDGADAVAAVQWQTTGKRKGRIIITSTAHYVFGTFYEYMKHPKKYGFKVYTWSIAKHISGEKNPLNVYTDKDPTHWVPNVWWLTEEEIQKKRRTKSDSEWLCEALGSTSLASGAVFKKDDLDWAICNICDECHPYDYHKCPLVKTLKLGTEEEPLKNIIDRRAGFDYGISGNTPSALTITGTLKGKMVFVLFNDEQKGLREEEKLDWIMQNLRRYNVTIFIPDPAVAGKHLNEPLEDKGFAVFQIAEKDKIPRVFNVINFVEKHRLVIPKAFWYLTKSLRKLAWKEERLKIRKIDDHSFDSLQYAMVDYRVEEGGDILGEVLKLDDKSIQRGIRSKRQESGLPSVEDLYGVDTSIKEETEEDKRKKKKKAVPDYDDLYS